MITVTKLNDKEVIINSDFIELIESNPDTMITMTTARKIIVKETIEELIEKITTYKKIINSKL